MKIRSPKSKTREDRGLPARLWRLPQKERMPIVGPRLPTTWQCGLDRSFRQTNEKDQEENVGENVAAEQLQSEFLAAHHRM